MELVRTPDNWDELTDIVRDMRGTQADLARVAIMAYQLGYRDACWPVSKESNDE